MNHADAFLEDIVAHPDDAAPRLIYADWLTEQDDPASRARAELIRVQYALEGLPPGDLRRVALEDRQRDILLAHEAEWTAGLRELGVQACTFRRGFAEGIKIHPGRLVQNGERIRALTPVHELQFCGWDPPFPYQWSEWPSLVQLPLLQRITALDVREFGSEALAYVLESPHLRHLQQLTLYCAGQTVQAVLRWPGLARLESLCASGLDARDFGGLLRSRGLGGLIRLELSAALRRGESITPGNRPHLGSLQHLTLSEVPDAVWDEFATASLPSLRSLVVKGGPGMGFWLASGSFLASLDTLDLASNGFATAALRPLTGATLPHLRRLILNGNRLGAGGALALAHADNLPVLESLNLRTNRLGDEGVAALLSGNLGLRELNVSYNGVTLRRLGSVVKRWPSKLEILDLSWNPLRDAGVDQLTSAPAFRGLKMLDLGYCQLTDRAAQALASCRGLAELHTLNLNTNRIGDAGLAALASSPHLGNLRTLHLGNTAVGDDGVAALLDSPLLGKLEVLMLNGACVSEAMRRRLRRAYRGILG